jgi:uncharacterized protein YdhG (YjbR/CyaY superfamily)
MKQAPKTIDAYLATVKGVRRETLTALRATIHRVLPEVEECISYDIPAFRVEGGVVAGFLATAKGCSYYPFSGRTLQTLASQLEAYGQTRGALHFPADTPLPTALVRRLIKARLKELAEKPARRKARRASG